MLALSCEKKKLDAKDPEKTKIWRFKMAPNFDFFGDVVENSEASSFLSVSPPSTSIVTPHTTAYDATEEERTRRKGCTGKEGRNEGCCSRTCSGRHRPCK